MRLNFLTYAFSMLFLHLHPQHALSLSTDTLFSTLVQLSVLDLSTLNVMHKPTFFLRSKCHHVRSILFKFKLSHVLLYIRFLVKTSVTGRRLLY